LRVPLTVAADDGLRTVRALRTSSSGRALLVLVGVAFGVVLLAILGMSRQVATPWPLSLLLGPPCVVLAAAAARTVPVTTRPADRAEKVLRGLLAGAAPVVLVWVLLVATNAPHMIGIAASPLALSGAVLAVRRAANRTDLFPEGHGLARMWQSVDDTDPLVNCLPLLCRSLKRSVDVVVAAAILVLSLPVLVIAAVAILAEGRGGVVFAQTRVGLGGRPFRMYKLRTMRPANDDGEHKAYVSELIRGQGQPQGGIYKLVADDRRTRVGRILRLLSLDELPQLWNVLRGDMSVVGPRPPLSAEVALYDEVARCRMATKPGLTGLWQVSGRSRLSFQEMVELDIRYWQQWSPLLDLRILARTPKAVLWDRETA
jgi:lipopolysaccharide/colanic/teichoic acid biosynthesis glycosyltransferase